MQRHSDEAWARQKAHWRASLRKNIGVYLAWIGVASNPVMKAIDVTDTENPATNDLSDSPIGGINIRPYVDASKLYQRRRESE